MGNGKQPVFFFILTLPQVPAPVNGLDEPTDRVDGSGDAEPKSPSVAKEQKVEGHLLRKQEADVEGKKASNR